MGIYEEHNPPQADIEMAGRWALRILRRPLREAVVMITTLMVENARLTAEVNHWRILADQPPIETHQL